MKHRNPIEHARHSTMMDEPTIDAKGHLHADSRTNSALVGLLALWASLVGLVIVLTQLRS